MLRDTQECSENRSEKQELSELKGSKRENREDNGSISDFVGLLPSASFFFGERRGVCIHC
ncbi:hypothetical protein C7120_11985 [Prevotella sp. oral taxon 376]|nr:hypothetical protein C7120_11985 [Prevotella sp. oral taxon 376]